MLFFFGRSIGTGPSVYMASRVSQKITNAPAALILQSPFTSVRDIAREMVGAIGNLVPKMFNNIENIQSVNCPILLIHGIQDDIIFVSHSDILSKNVKHTKFRYNRLANVNHNTFDEENDIILPCMDFLNEYFNPQGENVKVAVPSWLYQIPPHQNTTKEEKKQDSIENREEKKQDSTESREEKEKDSTESTEEKKQDSSSESREEKKHDSTEPRRKETGS